MEPRPRIEPETLLAQAAWMHALASSLLDDPAAADDVVQDASLAALRHSPADQAALVPWLARVVRNFAWRRRRDEARRLDRELRVAERKNDPTPAETLERLDLQQTLVETVRTIDEPLRTTLVLRYFEGRTSAEIARVQGVPPGTVRWRLKRGLDELRERLDKRFGTRSNWIAAFAPFALRDVVKVGTTTTASTTSVLKGVLAMSGAQVTLAAAAAALVIAGLWWGIGGNSAGATADPAQAPRSEAVEARAEPAPSSEVAREPAVAVADTAAVDAHSPKQAVADHPDESDSTAPAVAHVDARFIDAQGSPWSDVELAAHTTWGGPDDPTLRALSGVDGRVELDIPLDRRWTTSGEAPSVGYGFVATRSGCAAVKRSATLRSGEIAHLGDVVLSAGVRVLGHVRDATGRGLTGVSVGVVIGELEEDEGQMRRQGAKSFDATMSTRSAADGAFVIDGVEPGAHRLWAHAEGMRFTWTEPLDVPRDRDRTDVELVVVPLLVTDRIAGRVVDPQGQPLPRAQLTYHAHSSKHSLMTYLPVDKEGRFEMLIDYDEALYDFTASDLEKRFSATTTADVRPGTLDVELRLHEKRLLSVRLHDPEQRPIDDAEFDIDHRMSGGPADADVRGEGRYDVSVPDDEFRLDVSARGFRAVHLGPWTSATLPNPLDVELQHAPVVRGRVIADGVPLAGAKVALLGHDAGAAGTVEGFRCVYMNERGRSGFRVGADGTFALDADFAGAFWIRATAQGWTTGEVGPIEMTQLHADASFDVELTHGGAIEGRVLLPDGRDAEGAIVALNHGDGMPRTLRAGPKGVFRAEALAPGKWQVLPSEREIDPGTTTFSSTHSTDPIAWSCEVVAGRTTHFDLDLTSK